MSPLASLELVVHEGGRLEARIAGELDLASSGDVKEKLEPALGTATSAVLDLSGVTFLDSAGIRLLVQCALGMQRLGRLLEIVPPADTWSRKVLAVAQLEHVVTFRDAEEPSAPS